LLIFINSLYGCYKVLGSSPFLINQTYYIMKKSTLFGNLLVVIALASFVACGSAPKEETAAEEAVEEVAAEVEEVVEETAEAVDSLATEVEEVVEEATEGGE